MEKKFDYIQKEILNRVDLKKNGHGYVYIGEVMDLLDGVSDDDYQDALDAMNGCDGYNIINFENGDAYIVLANAIAIRNFVRAVGISDHDDCWGEYVRLKNGKCKQLCEFA